MIQFDEIPASRRTPGVYAEFNARLASNSLPANRQRVRLIGQRIPTNSPVAQDHVPVNIYSDAEAATIFGSGSHLHRMARAALRAQPYVQLCCVAVAEPSGAAAQGAVLLSGTATSSGVATLGIAADAVTVSVASGDTAQVVAAALVAALGNRPDLQISGSTTVSGRIDLAAKHVGVTGNEIGIRLSLTGVSGLTRTVTPMSSGVGFPNLEPALTAIYTAADDVLVMPYRDTGSITALREHLRSCGSGIEMRGAVGVVGHTYSYGDVVGKAVATNGERVLHVWLRDTQSLSYEVSAAMAATIAGVEDPARPLNHRVLAGIKPPPVESRATGAEVEGCLWNGVTPLVVGPGELVQVVRAVMSYTRNAAGAEDPAWLDITSIRSLDYARKAWRQRMLLRFPDDKMTDRSIAAVRSETLDVLLRLEELEILHNVRALKDRIVFEPSSQQTGTLVGRIPANVVPGLHVISSVFDLIL